MSLVSFIEALASYPRTTNLSSGFPSPCFNIEMNIVCVEKSGPAQQKGLKTPTAEQ